MGFWEERYQKAVESIIQYGALGYARGLTSGTGGNISCRCGSEVLITAGGVALRKMKETDVLLVDMDGNVLRKADGVRPSKETMFHLAIYKAREDVNCVYHVHPPFSTAYAVNHMEIPFVTCAAKVNVGAAPLVEYAPAGSRELSDVIERKIRQSDSSLMALVMAEHGIVTFATDLETCYDTAEVLEDTARIAIYAKIVSNK